MNRFELFKYGPEVIVKLTKDGLQVIFKLTRLRSALIEHFSRNKNPKLYLETSVIRAPASNGFPETSFLIRNHLPLIIYNYASCFLVGLDV